LSFSFGSKEQFKKLCSECQLRDESEPEDATPCVVCHPSPRSRRFSAFRFLGSSTRKSPPPSSSVPLPPSAAAPSCAPVSPSASSLPSASCEDPDWVPPPQRNTSHGSFQLNLENETFIQDMAPFADQWDISSRCLTEMFGTLINIGGGDPSDVTLSHSTIERRRTEAREDANLRIAFQNFDEDCTLHFDEVQLKLGQHQGGKTVKHLAITITGKVFQKSRKLIDFFWHLDLDVIDYGEFKYDLRKFLGLPP
jgi:hypothetical protein